MPNDKDVVRLRHMLDHSREAMTMAANRTQADLATDRMFELALVRLVEIIGEAATRVSSETQTLNPQISWRIITGMRNRLIHGYDQIAHDVLWNTVTVDLPPLIVELEKVLAARNKGG